MAFRWILERVEFTNKIELPPSEGVYTVGRGKENTIKCLSLYVSRKHCKIVQRAGSLTIVDLSSANGTFVNQTRILSEREIPLQDGDLIGVGVSETTDSGCYVFQLHRENFKTVHHVSALPDSSTSENEVVIIVDSDSENDLQECREAEAKETKNLPTEKKHVISSKVPRLENATMNQETSSALPVTYPSVFFYNREKPKKRLCDDPDDKIKIKRHVYEQNSRPPDDMSNKKTAHQSEVCNRNSKCEVVYKLGEDINTFNRSETILDTAQESKIVGDHLTSGAANSKSVEPVFQSSFFPESYVSVQTAVCTKRRFDSEPLSTTFTDCKTTTHRQTAEAESEILNHSTNDSLTLNRTMVFGVTEHKSEEMEIALQHSIKNRFWTELFNSKTNENRCSPVTKTDVPFLDDNSQRIPVVLTSSLNKNESEQNFKIEPSNKELAISDTKNSSRHNERQSPKGSKSLCFDLSEANKCVGTDSTVHSFNNFTGDSGYAVAHSSFTLESNLRTDSVITSESGTCVSEGDNLIPEVAVEREKDGVPFSLCGKSKSNRYSSSGIINDKQFPAAQECKSGKNSTQNKELNEKRKSYKMQNILSEPYSVEFSHIVSKCEQVSKSEQAVFFINKEVNDESCSYTNFKKQSPKYLETPVKKKLKMSEQSVGGSHKSGSSIVLKEPDIVSAKQNESVVISVDNKVRTGNKSHLLENVPTLNVINSHDFEDDEDAHDNLVSLRLQEVVYNDESKAKSNPPHVKYQDKHPKTIGKIKGSSGSAKQPVVKCGPLPAASLSSDDEQLVAKQKKGKLQRQRILFDSSSSSDEVVELQGKQKKLESAGETKGNSNSHVHLMKGKMKLLPSSDDDRVLVIKSSPESLDEVTTSNGKSDILVRNGVNSVDECKEKNTVQDNKHRVDSSNSVGKTMVNEELFASIFKSKAIVKLERLDENILKSNGLVVSEPESESLNYTLDEDIIVISDDDDDYFPSSQIFDDQNMSSLKALKTECQDAVNEDPSFNKDIEDDDVPFEDDDSDLDNQWFKRLSQQDLEPTSALPPQLQAETKTKDRFSRQKSLKDVNLPQVVVDDVRIQEELLASDLCKADEKVKLKRRRSVDKCQSNVKAFIIDAPPLPPRRAFLRGISADEAARIYKEQNESCQQPVKHRISDTSDKRRKRKRKEKKKEDHVHLPISDDLRFLTAKEKKKIADKRKEKLRAISEKEKAVAAASKKHSVKVPAEVRIKVTNKNRGAFLTEGAEKTNDVSKFCATAQTSVLSSVVKELHRDAEKNSSSLNVSKQDGVRSSTPQPRKCESRLSSAPARFIKDLPRIPKISERLSASKSVDVEVPPGAKVDTITEDVPPLLTSGFSSSPITKTLAPARSTKGKKRVTFKKDSELVEIRVIPVAEDSRLLPVAHKKDAPTPRNIFSNQLQQKGPDLEEVLYDIVCWNPKWLEEQRQKTVTYPPPVYGGKLWPMLSSFVSYKDYLKVLTPLVLLELWTNITKDCENNPYDPRKAPVVVGIDQVDATPHLTPNKKQLMHITCHALLTQYDSQNHLYPRVGDLVYLELELENEVLQNLYSTEPQLNTKQRRIVPIFAYVKHVSKDAVTSRTSVHREILKHCAEPSTKLTLILLAKFRSYDVKMSHAMRIKVVSYIKSDLRLFQAMAYLPSSPLCNHILKPAEQNFALPDITNDQFVPLIKQDQLNEPQKQAILQTAHACLMSKPKICMIQGPPGTGKSHVIVNLIIQILYAQKQFRKHGSRRDVPRILVCAPSNAAVDELVIRLLHVRQTIPREERFRMVRSGRQETMNQLVKDISVIELAKRDARNTAQVLECVESLDLEIRNLEARKNSLVMALETARQKNLTDTIAETEFKLGETELKLFQMKKSKTQNTTLDPRELWRIEREAQSRILLGADIVATTLSSCFNNQMETIFSTQKNSKDRSGFQFTCCIVDEATQSQELETLIPLMLGVTTLVLVGDAKQLPATVLSKMAKENGLGKSLFARLQTCFEDTVKNPVQFLRIQYRMHPDICLWPNRFFYNGRLISAPNLAQQRVCPLVPYCILSLDYKQDDSGELSNEGEAELVSQLTLGLLEKLNNQQLSIGIITPYNKQRTMIQSILRDSSCSCQNLEVNTIDSFQGQERDVIIMSCVRTGGIGFLADTQRLNVALTRARRSLLLCGNFTSLRNDNMWRALLENASQRNFLKHVSSSVAKNKDELLKLVLRDK
ncbi:uncharacterized protein LOC110828310 [Zootermopsis nevadensis]|uniref:Putative helicase senataxin n=1 Tax=Zootermopsis nevadensis TaxID=136037 RepID=A0A067RDW2_ZOONE|nr:uncharacterized protein LOC110828310 [Zootermopsis nevadensis]XP_021916613.1 uncharacterized protein LOC110828310 [Zootermopsis nevadensis]KDR21193.1 putative helicase senataxin [Zootermopsis nevadensis]